MPPNAALKWLPRIMRIKNNPIMQTLSSIALLQRIFEDETASETCNCLCTASLTTEDFPQCCGRTATKQRVFLLLQSAVKKELLPLGVSLELEVPCSGMPRDTIGQPLKPLIRKIKNDTMSRNQIHGFSSVCRLHFNLQCQAWHHNSTNPYNRNWVFCLCEKVKFNATCNDMQCLRPARLALWPRNSAALESWKTSFAIVPTCSNTVISPTSHWANKNSGPNGPA